MTYQQKIEEHGFVPMNHESPLYFPVELMDMQTVGGVTAPNWKAVTDGRTGDVMHVHTDRYELVPNEVIYNEFDRAIEASSLNQTDMVVKDDISHNGCRAFRQYLFPKHQIEINDNDTVALRIVAFNSYDGTMAFQARSGAYRFVCANTCLIGNDFANVRKKHTASFAQDMPAIVANVTAAAETFIEEAQRFQQWTEITCTLDQAMNLFENISGSTASLVGQLTANLVRVASAGVVTLWDIYNVLTSWSSHDVPVGNNAAYTQASREQRVLKLTNMGLWRSKEVDIGGY
tara:strand:+ start:1991 stop:2857 length:867 start_codon:yes stop_codon:yes gene_type:complete